MFQQQEQMDVNKKSALQFSLYAITSGSSNMYGQSMVDVMEQAILGGADIVQLRNKAGSRAEIMEQAEQLRRLTKRYQVPFIMNDDVSIAKEVGADGVHLGQDDLLQTSVYEARNILGDNAIIGVSTHHLDQALAAQHAGADYIGAGPVFATPTKPGRAAVSTSYIQQLAQRVTIPFVAIGGISLDNASEVLLAGAYRLCAVRAITDSAEPRAVCEQFRSLMQQYRLPPKWMICNGVRREIYAVTIEQLIDELTISEKQKHFVVELNKEILPRSRWSEPLLTEEASVELITFVGGG
ncbi:thiamine phosphate synthase [Paenibacillus yanchengensis]|uniref:Thiamine-phosphate synthase n=1 Tax=Paenibacillus yanchengensis TaxID=2035833 RepID=A0ABW4YNA4_9BACL